MSTLTENDHKVRDLTRIRMGPLTLHDVPVQVYAAANAPAPSGLIGSGLMRQFRVTLDLSARRLWLTPPPITILRS